MQQYILPLAPAAPELFLLGMACVILVADLFVSDDNRMVTYWLTQAALAAAFAITYATAAAEPAYTFSSMFVDDRQMLNRLPETPSLHSELVGIVQARRAPNILLQRFSETSAVTPPRSLSMSPLLRSFRLSHPSTLWR